MSIDPKFIELTADVFRRNDKKKAKGTQAFWEYSDILYTPNYNVVWAGPCYLRGG